METNETMGKKIGRVFLRIMSFVLTFVVAVALTLFISLKMFCSDSFPHVQQTFVTTNVNTNDIIRRKTRPIFLPIVSFVSIIYNLPHTYYFPCRIINSIFCIIIFYKIETIIHRIIYWCTFFQNHMLYKIYIYRK